MYQSARFARNAQNVSKCTGSAPSGVPFGSRSWACPLAVRSGLPDRSRPKRCPEPAKQATIRYTTDAIRSLNGQPRTVHSPTTFRAKYERWTSAIHSDGERGLPEPDSNACTGSAAKASVRSKASEHSNAAAKPRSQNRRFADRLEAYLANPRGRSLSNDLSLAVHRCLS